MPEPERKGYKRLNFFRGQKTSEADWAEEQIYRLDKHRLHNRWLHSAGIVVGIEGDLLVGARGDMSVEVQPGFAIDGKGNELTLADVAIRTVSTDAFKLPLETIFVLLRYVEEPTDFIAYKHNINIRGHRRMLETTEVVISHVPPKPDDEVELARINLEKGAKAIREAKNPLDPQANEIDLRFRPISATAGSRLKPEIRLAMYENLGLVRKAFTMLGNLKHGTVSKYMTTRNVVAVATQLQSMAQASFIDTRNFWEQMGVLVEVLAQLWSEVGMYDPPMLKRPDFVEFAKQMGMAQQLLNERRSSPEIVRAFLKYIGNGAQYLLQGFQQIPLK